MENIISCKGCNGCYTMIRCKRAKQNLIPDCPCGECLIKVVCDDPCEEYNKFWGYESIYNQRME